MKPSLILGIPFSIYQLVLLVPWTRLSGAFFDGSSHVKDVLRIAQLGCFAIDPDKGGISNLHDAMTFVSIESM